MLVYVHNDSEAGELLTAEPVTLASCLPDADAEEVAALEVELAYLGRAMVGGGAAALFCLVLAEVA